MGEERRDKERGKDIECEKRDSGSGRGRGCWGAVLSHLASHSVIITVTVHNGLLSHSPCITHTRKS
jgi:hypothetical protein